MRSASKHACIHPSLELCCCRVTKTRLRFVMTTRIYTIAASTGARTHACVRVQLATASVRHVHIYAHTHRHRSFCMFCAITNFSSSSPPHNDGQSSDTCITQRLCMLANASYIITCRLTIAAHHVPIQPTMYTNAEHSSTPSRLDNQLAEDKIALQSTLQ